MKSVLISIRPRWCEYIASGKKTIEVRKTAPKKTPFKAYIYAIRPKRFYKCGAVSTSDELLWLANGKVEMGDGFKFWADCDEYQCLNGRIIGEFICNEVEEFHEWELSPQGKFADFERERLDKFLTDACLSEEEVVRYRENLPYYKPLYGWHISDLKIYDKPKELSEFRKPFIDYVSPKESKMVNPKIGISEYVTCPPQSWIYVEELRK